MSVDVETLRPFLDRLLEEHDPEVARSRDPVEIPREYERAQDREVVALVASCLAYGQVDLLKSAIRRALEPLGAQPAQTLREARDGHLALADGFDYRMTKEADLADLYAAIGKLLRSFGSLESAYAEGGTSHASRARGLVGRLRDARRRDELHRGFRYLLPDPADGSACKRLHLFFRWVGRGPDAVDLGIWDALAPSELFVPLDTHTSRICRYIGLTDRKSVDGKMTEEVTRALRRLDPSDPVKYDFAICQLGISDSCIHERSEEHCPTCPIEPACRLQ